jgi:hypothetical protein
MPLAAQVLRFIQTSRPILHGRVQFLHRFRVDDIAILVSLIVDEFTRP